MCAYVIVYVHVSVCVCITAIHVVCKPAYIVLLQYTEGQGWLRCWFHEGVFFPPQFKLEFKCLPNNKLSSNNIILQTRKIFCFPNSVACVMALNATHYTEKMPVIGTNRLNQEQNTARADSKVIQNDLKKAEFI